MRQVCQERSRAGLGPAAIGGIAPLKAGVTAIGTRPALSYGGRAMGVLVWRQHAPRASFRERVAAWRARNWRRVVLAWFVLSLIIMAVAVALVAGFTGCGGKGAAPAQTPQSYTLVVTATSGAIQHAGTVTLVIQ